MLRSTGQLIGACGYAPCLAPFDALSSPAPVESAPFSKRTAEVGLFYTFSPTFQRQGYATEAAKALVDYAFKHLDLKRIVAMTTYANAASMQVMKKLGMRLERNPHSEPPWFQAVGILDNT